MAVAVIVDGPALIRIDAGEGLESLGYTANGADVSFNGFFGDVPGDQNGGDQGPPIDVQYFGETADLAFDLTKYEASVFQKIMNRLATAAAGVPGVPGTLMAGASETIRILISPTNNPQNFPVCIVRSAIEYNKSTRFKRARFTATAYENSSGVLWNEVTS